MQPSADLFAYVWTYVFRSLHLAPGLLSIRIADRRVKDPFADRTCTHPLAQEPKRMSLATGQCRSGETDSPLTYGAWPWRPATTL